MLKVVPSSPASVSSSQSLLEQDTKPLIALWLCASWPTPLSQLSGDTHTYAYEGYVQRKCSIPVFNMIIANILKHILK